MFVNSNGYTGRQRRLGKDGWGAHRTRGGDGNFFLANELYPLKDVCTPLNLIIINNSVIELKNH